MVLVVLLARLWHLSLIPTRSVLSKRNFFSIQCSIFVCSEIIVCYNPIKSSVWPWEPYASKVVPWQLQDPAWSGATIQPDEWRAVAMGCPGQYVGQPWSCRFFYLDSWPCRGSKSSLCGVLESGFKPSFLQETGHQRSQQDNTIVVAHGWREGLQNTQSLGL